MTRILSQSSVQLTLTDFCNGAELLCHVLSVFLKFLENRTQIVFTDELLKVSKIVSHYMMNGAKSKSKMYKVTII